MAGRVEVDMHSVVVAVVDTGIDKLTVAVCIPPWTWPSTIWSTMPTVYIDARGDDCCCCCRFCSDDERDIDAKLDVDVDVVVGKVMFSTAMPNTDGKEPVHPAGTGWVKEGEIAAVTAWRASMGEAFICVIWARRMRARLTSIVGFWEGVVRLIPQVIERRKAEIGGYLPR